MQEAEASRLLDAIVERQPRHNPLIEQLRAAAERPENAPADETVQSYRQRQLLRQAADEIERLELRAFFERGLALMTHVGLAVLAQRHGEPPPPPLPDFPE